MGTENWIQNVGLVASITLPFFNIPLMIRMVKRRSSEDLSLIWVVGVFSCLLAILPTAWLSTDFVFKVFSIVNVLLFSGVVVLALFFRFAHKTKRD
ncbi:MAG: hypothetical protein HYW02_06835 [Deltaproteobacteria bacterium]|nr:hypothetical protein [Deltaproteobacteria bacterium]MBI2501161.1 hypothetical protein [Deltaproteobacteria bacterium]MBI4196389.1 hypothetical protein [Deltaproteobacteria bacterium]